MKGGKNVKRFHDKMTPAAGFKKFSWLKKGGFMPSFFYKIKLNKIKKYEKYGNDNQKQRHIGNKSN